MLTLDPILSLSHSLCAGRGVYAVLLGSGVSRSAGIPTGWEVTLDLVRRLASLEGKDAGDRPDEWFRADRGIEPGYSSLLAALAGTPAERRALLQSYFEPNAEERERGLKVPTPAHRAVARLVASGHVRVVLTTNFDRLMETALAEEGVAPAVISNGDQAQGSAPLVHQRCVVVKLHGDYLDDRIMNVETELATYDERMARLLDRVLDEYGLVISGWSGDWDPALRSALERCPSRRYSTFWGIVGEPSAVAAGLISQRAAQVVRTSGADALFTAVEGKVRALDEVGAPHPLAVASAVAEVKRYVVEDRFRVRLEDLLFDEVLRVREVIDGKIPRGTAPNEENLPAIIRKLDALSETLRAVFFHGCRLGRVEHDRFFLDGLRLLAPREEWMGPVYTAWADMRLYPMATVLYAAGLGALASGRWALLRALLTLPFKACGNERWACRHLAALSVLDETAAKTVAGKMRLPASEHFFQLLAPLAGGLVPDVAALFDRLEVWVSLAATEGHEPAPGAMPYIPIGRFMWRRQYTRSDTQPETLFAEAAEAGRAWPPIVNGWFGGTEAGFEAARALVAARVERAASQFW